MNTPTIALTGVSHAYGRASPALVVPELVMAPGATAVLGPNGSGKSTLLRLLATLHPPGSGSIRVAGLDPTDPVERTAIRRRLGYVAQNDGLPPRMRVHDYCDYVAALKEIGPARLRRRWIAWVLERVGLHEATGRRIATLSGGMQRRLSIAQSLLGDPDLLVLDEPLTSLDAEQRAVVASLVVERALHATIVVATHHADELASVCDRVVVLDDGRVVFAGRPDALASMAVGQVWQADRLDPTAACRAIAPGRFRCVGPAPPPGATLIEPTVADGYLILVRRR